MLRRVSKLDYIKLFILKGLQISYYTFFQIILVFYYSRIEIMDLIIFKLNLFI